MVLCLAFLLSGCVPEEATIRSSALYEEGVRHYLAGEYAQGAGGLSRAAVEAEDPAVRAKAGLLKGRCHLAMRQFHQAEAAFRRGLEAGSASKEVRAGLELGLADSLYGQERYPEAADSYHGLLRRFSGLVPADEATFKLAIAYQRSGLWEEARRHFARVASEFPESPRAEAARRYAERRSSGFAVQCGAFGSTEAASRLAGELRKKGFAPRSVPVTTTDGRRLTAVQVGSFRTWTEAVELRSRLQAAGFEARIVP